MSVPQHVLINTSNGNGSTNTTLHHYLSNNHITNDSNKNAHVQIVKQEHQNQRFILNRQFMPQQNQHIQIQQAPNVTESYYLIVEIESNNEINSYAFVESKDVVNAPPLNSLTTGKLLIVNINNKQRRATVVMASSEFFEHKKT